MRNLNNNIQRLSALLEEQFDICIIKYETINDPLSFDVFLKFQMKDIFTGKIFYIGTKLSVFNVDETYDEVKTYVNNWRNS
jgi:hypothetical protein